MAGEWPDLLGRDGEEAAAVVRGDVPHCRVSIVREDAPVTRDYRADRVRLFVDGDGRIARVPRVG